MTEPRCYAYMCGLPLAGHPEPPAASYHAAVLARARREAARKTPGWERELVADAYYVEMTEHDPALRKRGPDAAP